MQIDRLQEKGKNSKGKGKSKDQTSKGKGKGNQNGTKGKGKGQKGQDYTGGKSSQKGSGKGEQKGKGKSQLVKECYICDKPGHLPRDCWRVRQVAESPGGADKGETSTVLSSGVRLRDQED